MSYSHCGSFNLPCDLREFIFLFWEDEQQHVDFLERAMNETNINISPWSLGEREEKSEVNGNSWLGGTFFDDTDNTVVVKDNDDQDKDKVSLWRTVEVDHPLPVLDYLPWIPASVKNNCKQTITYHSQSPNRLTVEERSVVTAIPWVTPIIAAIWTVEQREDGTLDCSIELSFSDCNVIFIQPLIELYAQSGLQAYFAAWQPHAASIISKRREGGKQSSTIQESSGPVGKFLFSKMQANVVENVESVDCDGKSIQQAV